MAVSPVSGVTPPVGPSGPSGVSPARQPSNAPRFADALKDYLGSVDQQQQSAGAAVQDLVAGKSQDVLGVVTTVAKADMSFKLLIGVRNKVIEAYKQTMNMQV